MKGAREISVYPISNGFVVNAGCLTLAFTDKQKLVAEFARWVADPAGTEAAYMREHDRSGIRGIDTGYGAAQGIGATAGVDLGHLVNMKEAGGPVAGTRPFDAAAEVPESDGPTTSRPRIR